ncbi:ABC transporter ATP-binding protein [Leucobacter weissii]|uniref:ABC-type quaternary amine transporter n=1 Tax=Leucobacter weissii TaxID=1983706 RepID=A0A939SAE7_9MICO|nr:ABC transporter ATP-binding protein [Leucobacter weissii]MBO1900343.1 ABC transporter ATP-binding protein [Leucobacter weissii]
MSIELKHVSKRYPGVDHDSVRDLSLSVGTGEFVALIGGSGCGKSTTMRMINRLIEPTSGDILIDGESVTGVDPVELRRKIGYVIQSVGLMPHLTVGQNIGFVASLMKQPKPQIAARVEELLDTVGLDPAVYRDRYPRQLSGGQQQRAGVARSLMLDPPLILMDEPFGAIDALLRKQLQIEVRELQQRLKKTVVIVTHDISEAFLLGDRVAVMDRGELLQVGTPHELINAPAHRVVADFLDDEVKLRRLDLLTVADALDLAPTTEPTAGEVSIDGSLSLRRGLLRVAEHAADSVLAIRSGDRVLGRITSSEFLRYVAQNTNKNTEVVDVVR